MAKFHIATPGGFEVEVTAESESEAVAKARKDWQAMPRIIAKQGKTRVFERSNGQRYVVSPGYSSTNPEKVAEALSGMTGAEISSKGIDEAIIAENPMAARAGEFVRGTPFVGSYSDELIGALAGPEAGAAVRAASGAMQRQRPGETMALNLAGGLTGGAGMAAAAPAALSAGVSGALGQGSRLSQIGRGLAAGAAAGGIEGGIYGAGEGDAATGAAFGTGFGGLLGGAAPIVRSGLKNVTGIFKRSDVKQIARDLNISEDAAKVIKATFDQGGDIQAAQANLAKAGKEAMLADAGEAAQALLDASAQSGGRAKSIASGAISERMARTGQALDASLDEALGPVPEGPRSAVNAIAERTAPARKQAYDLAYSVPIDYSAPSGMKIEETLRRIDPKVTMAAINEANEEMLSKGMRNQQIMASIADNGDVVYIEMPNVQQLDEVKKGLQKLAYDNTDDFGRLTGTGQRYNRLASELRDAVADAVDPYGAAVSIGGDKLAEERAFSLGYDLLRARTNVEDVAFELGQKPSEAQIASAKQGLRTYIAKTLGDVRGIASNPSADEQEARKVIKAVTDMSSDNAREKIRRLMGAEADALLAQVDEAAQSASVRAELAINSKTAPRRAIQKTIEDVTSPGMIQQAASGEAVEATKQMVRGITGMTDEFTVAQRQKVFQDIARALTEKSGDDARMALAALDRAMQGQELTEAQVDLLSNTIAGVLFVGATPSAGRAAGSQYQ